MKTKLHKEMAEIIDKCLNYYVGQKMSKDDMKMISRKINKFLLRELKVVGAEINLDIDSEEVSEDEVKIKSISWKIRGNPVIDPLINRLGRGKIKCVVDNDGIIHYEWKYPADKKSFTFTETQKQGRGVPARGIPSRSKEEKVDRWCYYKVFLKNRLLYWLGKDKKKTEQELLKEVHHIWWRKWANQHASYWNKIAFGDTTAEIANGIKEYKEYRKLSMIEYIMKKLNRVYMRHKIRKACCGHAIELTGLNNERRKNKKAS